MGLRKIGFIAIAVMTVLMPSLSPTQALAASDIFNIKEGDEVPWFSGWTASNRVVSRTSLQKDQAPKSYLLVFAASWCEACKVCLKGIKDKRGEIVGAGIKPYAVDFMEDEAAAVEYFGTSGFDKDTVILDKFGKVLAAVGKMKDGDSSAKAALPLTVVFGRDAKISLVSLGCPTDYIQRILTAGRKSS